VGRALRETVLDAPPPLLETRDLKRHYVTPAGVVKALDGVSMSVAAGEVVALLGTSGSGKSTLLNVLGGLDRPTQGAVCFRGVSLAQWDAKALAAYRRRDIGVVFQSFNLIPHRSALDNVGLPLMLAGVARGERRERARAMLAAVGLAARAEHRPAELSGGEQQRVAIARALANAPSLLLADEPTGNLDSATAGEVLELLFSLSVGQGKTLLIVTHDDQIASRASRRIRLCDGREVGA
jgi:putative ABC transport system ATP-binding protein